MMKWEEANKKLLEWRGKHSKYNFPIDVYGVFNPQEITGNVLDIGAGSGYAERFPNARYVGIDPCFQGPGVINCKGEDYKPDRKFDSIFCISTMPHVEDVHKILNNCKNWLVANGTINFVIAYTEKGETKPEYVNFYDKNEWEEILNKYFHRNFSFVFEKVLFYQGVNLE